MKTTTLYLLDPKMKWRTFKTLQERMVQKDGGPTPEHLDKVLWRMLRDRQVYCGFREDVPGNMWIGLVLPDDVEIAILKDPPQLLTPSHE